MKFLSAATFLCIALVGQIQGGSLRGLPVHLPHQSYGVPVDNDIQSEKIKPSSLPNINEPETNEVPHPSGAFIDNLPLVDSVGNVGKPADTYGPPTEKNEDPHPSGAVIDTLPLVDNVGKPADTYGPPTENNEVPHLSGAFIDTLPLVDNDGKPADTYGPPTEKNEVPHPSGAFINTLPLVANGDKPADTYGPPTEKNEVHHPSDASIGTLPLDNTVVNLDKSPDSYGLPIQDNASDTQKHEGPSDFLPSVDRLPLVDSVVNFGKPADIYGPPTVPTTIDIQQHQDPSVFQSHVDILPLVDNAVDFGKPSETFVSSTTAKPELPYLPPGLPALPKLPFRPIVVEELDHVDQESNSGVPSADKFENHATYVDIYEPPGTHEVSEDTESKIPKTSVTGKPSPVYGSPQTPEVSKDTEQQFSTLSVAPMTGKPSPVYGPPSKSEVSKDTEQQFPTLLEAPVTAQPTTPRGREEENPGKPGGTPPAAEVSNETEQEIDALPEGPTNPTTPKVSEVPVELNNDLPRPNEAYGPQTTPPASSFDEQITINKIPVPPEAHVAGHPSIEQDNASSRPNEVNAQTTAQMVVFSEDVPADHPTTPMISDVSVEKNDGFPKPIDHYGPSPTTKPTNGNGKIELPTIDKIPALPEYPIIPQTTSAEVSEVAEKQNGGYNYEIPAIGFPTPIIQDSKIPVNPAKPLNKPATYHPAEEVENSNPSAGYGPPTGSDGLEPSAALSVHDNVKPDVIYRPTAVSESLEVPTTPSTQKNVKPNEVYEPLAGSEPLEPSTTPTANDKLKPNEPYGTLQKPEASSDTGEISFPIISQIPALPNAPITADLMSSKATEGPPKQNIGYNYDAPAVAFPTPVVHAMEAPVNSLSPSIIIPTFPLISEIPALPNAPPMAYPTPAKVSEGPPKPTSGYNYDTPAVSFPTPVNHATEVPAVSISPSIVIPTKVNEPSIQLENNPSTGETTQDHKFLETSSTTSGIDKVKPNEVYPRPQRVDTSTDPKPPQHPIISKIRALAEIPHLFKKAFVESFGIKVPEDRFSNLRSHGLEFPVSATKGAPRSVFKPSYLNADPYGSQLPVQPLILQEFVQLPVYEPTPTVNDGHKPRNDFGKHVASPTPFGLPMPMHAIPKLFDRLQPSPISEIRGLQHIPLFVEEFQTVPSSVGRGTTGTFSNLIGTASPTIYQTYPGLISGPNTFISQKGRHREIVGSSVSTLSHQVNHYTAPNAVQPYPDSIVVEEPKKGGFTIHSITGKTENSSVKSFSHVSIVPHSPSFGTTAGHQQ